MTKEAMELLSQYGGEEREKYSGRNMYGNKTCGIIFDTHAEFFNALADCISDCIEEENRANGEILCNVLRKLRTDNMGTSIIYY
jgi:hypothetical protein